MRLLQFCFLLSACLAIFSCSLLTRKKKLVRSPAGYDLSSPTTIRLDENLDEISGIAYDQAGNRLVAVNDEEGRIYFISLPDGKVKRGARFAKSGDYEDILIQGNDCHILKSNGDLYTISDFGGDSLQPAKTSFTPKGKYDFESIFMHPVSRKLVILCKTCPGQTNQIPGYTHDAEAGKISDTATFHLDFSALPDSFPMPEKNIIHPSAAAVHPVTGNLFVLASANGLLIIANKDGVVMETYKLDLAMFKQPEGICFAPDGGLYISNEAGTGFANIHHFPFAKSQ